jgi:hypothetical protein
VGYRYALNFAGQFVLCPALFALQINAEKAPYLTDKLKVWMLPTLALIKAEKVVDYVVGFDDMGGKDDFTTGGVRFGCVRWCVYGGRGLLPRQLQWGVLVGGGGVAEETGELQRQQLQYGLLAWVRGKPTTEPSTLVWTGVLVGGMTGHALIKGEKVVDYVVGCDDMEGKDDFTTGGVG